MTESFSPIHWFPGHMQSALRAIAKRLGSADVVIEILDARAPAASHNPELEKIAAHKRIVRVLAKADLADPAATNAWLRSYRPHPAIAAVLSGENPTVARTLSTLILKSAGRSSSRTMGIRAVVVGIPNVGKSTFINRLAGRRKLVVRDQPGVTRSEQLVKVGGELLLWDTPGVQWPRLEDREMASRLAAIGTVSSVGFDVYEVALFVLDHLRKRYPDALVRAYSVNAEAGTPEMLLQQIGVARGHVAYRGRIDTTRAARTLLRDLGVGRLGRLSFEWPHLAQRE